MRNNGPRRLGLVLAFLVGLRSGACEQARRRMTIGSSRGSDGPIELGMTAADLARTKGDPTQTSRGPTGGISVYTWKNDLSVYIKSDGSYVTQICALDPAYATAVGVHPGMPDVSVTALLGQPKSSRVYRGWWRLSYTNLFWPGLIGQCPPDGVREK